MARYVTSEEAESKKRKELMAQRRAWMEEKHSCLTALTREEMFRFQLIAVRRNYEDGSGRKLACHSPITFKNKYDL